MKIMIVFGTRPELIKFVPVIYTLRKYHDLVVVHSRQHEELTDDLLDFFEIKPDYFAPDMVSISEDKTRQFRYEGDLPRIMRLEKPQLALVQGDTLTAFLGAFVAFSLHIPILHLEAGLRTGDRFAPYPEEALRMMITQISDFHFAHTCLAARNLVKEGISGNRIFVTGNTVIDATLLTLKLIEEKPVHKILNATFPGLKAQSPIEDLVLITAHRNENIGKPLENICDAVKQLCVSYPELSFVWLIHRNPKVREIVLRKFSDTLVNFCVIEAITYPKMVYLMSKARCVLTDSGGIQEEATALNTPIMILREQTERPEVLSAAQAYLVGNNVGLICNSFAKLIKQPRSNELKPSPYGDGKTALRLLRFLESRQMQEFIQNYPDSGNMVFTSPETWLEI